MGLSRAVTPIADRLRARVTDYTPGVGRVFLRCGAGPRAGCNRVVPHYRIYGKHVPGACRCGHEYFRPARIPEWKAAWFLFIGWASGKGDPRMPMRSADSPYA